VSQRREVPKITTTKITVRWEAHPTDTTWYEINHHQQLEYQEQKM
jgi:hypothetical protein